eukprot:863800-Amphidinium_carterae.1
MYHNGQGVREGMRRSGVPRSEVLGVHERVTQHSVSIVFLTSKIPPERMGYEEAFAMLVL